MPLLQFDFEKRKFRVIGKVIFETEINIEVEADSFRDGTLYESLQKIAKDAAADEAHRKVQAGLAQLRYVDIHAVLIPTTPTERNPKENKVGL